MSQVTRLRLGTLLLAAAFAAPQSAFAWGARGHDMIGELGAQLATQGQAFWSRASDAMGVMANVPDNTWKSGASKASESTTHWFEPDQYYSDQGRFGEIPHSYSEIIRRFTEPTVRKNGTAPWRIQQLYDLAVAALRARDPQLAVQMAGTMAHYVGDLAQPLHVTKNYDGQLSGNQGLHSYFESQIVSKADLTKLQADVIAAARLLLADPRFVAEAGALPREAAFSQVWRSFPHVATVLRNDDQLGRGATGTQAQLTLVVERMADGAATLAVILGRLWDDAGRPALTAPTRVATPRFVDPRYLGKSSPRNWSSSR